MAAKKAVDEKLADEAVVEAPVSTYDPVEHMLGDRVSDLKAQLKAAEKALADHLG